MAKRKLLWQLYPLTLAVTLISVLSLAMTADRTMRLQYEDRTAAHLLTLVGAAAATLEESTKAQSIAEISRRWGQATGVRLTVISLEGKVLGDSHKDPLVMENHAQRPEIIDALKSDYGRSRRHSNTLNVDMMYVAKVWKNKDKVRGFIRTALPLSSIEATLQNFRSKIIFSSIFLAVLLGVVSWFLAKRISAPLETMRLGAEAFARGELSQRLVLPESEEAASLAKALNQMASELDARLKSMKRQKNEQTAVLESMSEGLLAISHSSEVLRMNESAARLLGTNAKSSIGKTIDEVLRDPDLRQFIESTLKKAEALSREIHILNAQGQQRILQLEGRSLLESDGERLGGLVVLTDVTELRRLEKIRKDFVANVSHELKTPITSIKGFVETLQDGGLNNKKDAQRYLAIIEKHAARMNEIVEDLLQLSRLEADGVQPALSFGDILPAMKRSLELLNSQFKKKSITLISHLPSSAKAHHNVNLLEQALSNLLDNAIKYSFEKSEIEVRVSSGSTELRIDIIDHGRGISQEHLPRLFERFYRIDAARSRKEGGTGLGLAIVKHVIQAQNGRISVESTAGKGSLFSLFLKNKPQA